MGMVTAPLIASHDSCQGACMTPWHDARGLSEVRAR